MLKKVKVKDIALSTRNKKGCLGIKAIKSNPHQFVDCLKVSPKQDISIVTMDGTTKLNTALLKPVDLNSVGTNMVDSPRPPFFSPIPRRIQRFRT